MKQSILIASVKLLLFAVFSQIAIQLNAQDALEFREVIIGPTPTSDRTPAQSVKPVNLKADTRGGSFEVNIQHKKNATQDCASTYQFDWEFSQPINELKKGQKIDISYSVTRLGSSCPTGKARIFVHTATGSSPQFKQTGVSNSIGIGIQPFKWIEAGFHQQTERHTSKLLVLNPGVKNSTLKFSFDSSDELGGEQFHYEVVYIFENKRIGE